jgi:hypothetical protein
MADNPHFWSNHKLLDELSTFAATEAQSMELMALLDGRLFGPREKELFDGLMGRKAHFESIIQFYVVRKMTGKPVNTIDFARYRRNLSIVSVLLHRVERIRYAPEFANVYWEKYG